MANYISGKIIHVIYESPTSTYKVGILRCNETNIEELNEYSDKKISFTGNFNELNKNLEYTFYGKIVNHPRYGTQFNVTSYEIKEPSEKESIIDYLSSGMFPGIGEKMAAKIVNKFDKDTLNVIRDTPNELTSIKGLSLKKINILHDKLTESTLQEEYIIMLNKVGFNIKESMSLLKKYNSNIFKIIDNDIYELVSDIDFSKIDNIFLKSNDEKSEVRIKALIKHNIYNSCYESGNTLISYESLFIKMKSCFNSEFNSIEYTHYMNELINSNTIIKVNDFVALYDFYCTEELIINNIERLNKIKNSIDMDLINKQLDSYMKDNDILLDSSQLKAIKDSIKNNFYIITGGPGTGKTTIVKAIVDTLLKLEMYSKDDIALLAPTGRSAKRMMESVSFPASTIHKYLKWNKETNEFGLNENNKSTHKLVIVDEASMLDIFLFSSLLKSLRLNVKIILLGDANQLPSIGPGDILNDLLNDDKVNKTYLTNIYRTKKNSYINLLANDIKNKKTFDKVDNYDDFKFITCDDEVMLENLKTACNKIIKNKISLDNFQVLIPMYKGLCGIDNVNNILSELFNPNSKKITIGDKIYKVGDKVIQLINDVDNNIYNGDIGYIDSINKIDKEFMITINFDGNYVDYTFKDLDKFSLAYAVSIHKAQGSEYEHVIVLLSRHFNRMFYNKLIYTAVSRAKSSLVIFGNLDSFNKAILIDYSDNRITYFKVNKYK